MAGKLFEQGNFSAALKEYQRVLLFSSDTNVYEIHEAIGDCHFRTGDIQKAAGHYENARLLCNKDEACKSLTYRICSMYLLMGDVYNAHFELSKVPSADRDKQYFFLAGACFYSFEQYDDAADVWKKGLSLDEDNAIEIHRFDSIFKDVKKIGRPSPAVASVLSIFVPGLGQTVAGKPMDGLNSFALLGTIACGGFYIASHYTVLDAVLTAAPLARRYYKGGVKNSRQAALDRSALKKQMIFNGVLDLYTKKSDAGS